MKWFNKKGMAKALIAFIVGLFSLAISILLATVVYTNFDSALTTEITDPAVISASNTYANSFSLMDKMYLFAVIAFTLWLFITSFLVESHPIFFSINVVVIMVGIVFSAFMANVYKEIATTPAILNATSDFAVVPLVMGNLPYYVLVIGFIAAVIMFSKFQGGGE